MALWSRATYLGPPDSNWAGSMVEYRGLVEHIAQGSYQGTISWQKNPVSDVSSHFVIDYDGTCAQLLDTSLTAWTQSAGNGHWVSAELAGFNTGVYTPEQQETLSQLYAWLHTTHGVMLQLTDSPSGRGWGWHGMGGTAWGNHPDCPGPNNVAARGAMLNRTVQILGGVNPGRGPFAPPPTDLRAQRDADMFRLIDIDGRQFYVGSTPLSPTGWFYVDETDRINAGSALPYICEAAGMGTADPRKPGVNLGPGANDWRPGAFGPTAGQVRSQAIADIVDAVVERLPATGGGGGAGLTVSQVAAAVRAELDNTRFLGQLERDPSA